MVTVCHLPSSLWRASDHVSVHCALAKGNWWNCPTFNKTTPLQFGFLRENQSKGNLIFFSLQALIWGGRLGKGGRDGRRKWGATHPNPVPGPYTHPAAGRALLSRSTLDFATAQVLQYFKLTSYCLLIMLCGLFFFFFNCKWTLLIVIAHTKASLLFQRFFFFFNCLTYCSENPVGTEWEPLGLAPHFGSLVIKRRRKGFLQTSINSYFS